LSRTLRNALIGPTSWIALLAAGIVVPILAITLIFLHDVDRLKGAADAERAGITRLTALDRVLRDASDFRSAQVCGPGPISPAAIDRDIDALSRLERARPFGQTRWTDAIASWRRHASPVARADDLLDRIAPLFITISDDSGITYDPEIRGIDLGDALAYRLPRVVDDFGRIEVLLCSRRAAAVARAAIPVARMSGAARVLLDDAEQDLHDAGVQDPAARTTFESSARRAAAATTATLARLDQFERRPDPHVARDVAATAIAANGALYALGGTVGPALDHIAGRRIVELQQRYYLTLVPGTLAMLAAALFVLFGARTVLAQAELARVKRTASELEYHATHDPLTGLPNRAAFATALEETTTAFGAQRGCASVLFIDLDNFKLVNDSLGHAAGDVVLCTVANRLAAICQESGGVMIARFGGDEFALLIADARRAQLRARVERIVGRIADDLVAPVPLGNQIEQQVAVSASVGIACVGSDDHDRALPAELLRNADVAMYEAKSRGRACAATFGPAMHERAVRKLQLTSDLRGAAERGEFVLECEPIVRLRDGARIASEALIRWNHPALGRLAPGAFLPVAEESGAIVSIGNWVLGAALGGAGDASAGLVHVNLAVQDLAEATLMRTVATLLERNGLTPNLLAIEITEGSLVRSGGRAEATLKHLRRLGVRIWIDDFGVEYSSLRYLDRLPVDGVKIDRSFIGGADGKLASPVIVKTIVELAKSFDLEVIAEGIETREQRDALVELGCTYGQGYLYAQSRAAGVADTRESDLTML
jgi:diguanylate cyclase (GGDEF)-like protein